MVSIQHADHASRSTPTQELGVSPSWAITQVKRRIRSGWPVNARRLEI